MKHLRTLRKRRLARAPAPGQADPLPSSSASSEGALSEHAALGQDPRRSIDEALDESERAGVVVQPQGSWRP